MRELREAVWDGVPHGAEPEHFAARRALLLAALQAFRAERPPGAPLRVLDAGCGAGEFAAALVAAGATVIAADAADGALARAAVAAPAAGPLAWRDGEPLALGDASIDFIWAGETLEHVGDGEDWLGELRRVLAPGGRLLLTTPDHPLLLRLRLAASRRAFDDHLAPWRDHLRFFTADSLRALLERAGFAEIEIAHAPWRRRRGGTLVATAATLG